MLFLVRKKLKNGIHENDDFITTKVTTDELLLGHYSRIILVVLDPDSSDFDFFSIENTAEFLSVMGRTWI